MRQRSPWQCACLAVRGALLGRSWESKGTSEARRTMRSPPPCVPGDLRSMRDRRRRRWLAGNSTRGMVSDAAMAPSILGRRAKTGGRSKRSPRAHEDARSSWDGEGRCSEAGTTRCNLLLPVSQVLACKVPRRVGLREARRSSAQTRGLPGAPILEMGLRLALMSAPEPRSSGLAPYFVEMGARRGSAARRHKGLHSPQGLYPWSISSSSVADDSSLFLSAIFSRAPHPGRWIFMDDVLRM